MCDRRWKRCEITRRLGGGRPDPFAATAGTPSRPRGDRNGGGGGAGGGGRGGAPGPAPPPPTKSRQGERTVAEAVLTHPAVEPAESPLTPESWGKLGMWIFLAGDAVGFGTLLGAYGAGRAASADWPTPAERLGITLTAVMTFLLICSSVTMVKALEAIKRGDRPGGPAPPRPATP